mmetsp:Transcript_69341/g.224170  ORF Transcript_69341/g.224170 Transcript_69341/m.224170 type:complete len:397 (+) Transcript_69341:212-1402(+)
MVGSNVLFLPDAVRIARGVPYALALLAAMAVLSFASMVILARCCERTQCFSYRELWSRALGERSLWVVDLSIAANAIIACVSYCLLIERFLEVAVHGLLPGSAMAALPSAWNLAAVMALVVFPLCLMRDLGSLKATSSLGLGVTLVVAAFVAQDCFASAGASLPVRGGLTSLEVLSTWDPVPGPHLFQAAALLTNAFSVHYNVPKLYGELAPQERSVPAFRRVALATFACALATEVVFILCGYGRFGGGVESTLLASYPPGAASLGCWLLMAANLTFTYPIVFHSARASCLAFLEETREPRWLRSLATNRAGFTALLVAGTAVLGHGLTSLSFINALKGALALSAIAFVFPGLLHLRLFAHERGGGAVGLWAGVSRALVLWGVLSCALGLAVLALG